MVSTWAVFSAYTFGQCGASGAPHRNSETSRRAGIPSRRPTSRTCLAFPQPSLGARVDVGAPAAEVRDLLGILEGPGLAQEALHPTAVLELEAPDAQWRRDQRDKAAVMSRRQPPHLHYDGAARTRSVTHPTRLGRRRLGQGIQTITRCGVAGPHQEACTLYQLVVERLAAQVRPDHGHIHCVPA